MPVWLPAPVTVEPELTLICWRVMQTEHAERHFVGIRADTRTGRVSSPICELNPATLSGRTTTGRKYRVSGPARWDIDALYTWLEWCALYGVVACRDVTDYVLAVYAAVSRQTTHLSESPKVPNRS